MPSSLSPLPRCLLLWRSTARAGVYPLVVGVTAQRHALFSLSTAQVPSSLSVHCTCEFMSPCSGRDCVKSLRSFHMGLYPQTFLPPSPPPPHPNPSPNRLDQCVTCSAFFTTPSRYQTRSPLPQDTNHFVATPVPCCPHDEAHRLSWFKFRNVA